MKQKSDQTHLSSGRLQYNLLGSLLKARTGLPEETLDKEEKNGRFPVGSSNERVSFLAERGTAPASPSGVPQFRASAQGREREAERLRLLLHASKGAEKNCRGTALP